MRQSWLRYESIRKRLIKNILSNIFSSTVTAKFLSRISYLLYFFVYCFFGCLFISFVIAKAPNEPYFSTKSKQLSEPPALPQIYGIELPNNIVEFFPSPPPKESFNAFLPPNPMIMEVCAITGQPLYYYASKEELLNGCYRGDSGLSFFELQPYQYWQALTPLKEVQLIPYNHLVNNVIRILVNYKYVGHDESIASIEIGDTNYPATFISINGQNFQNNYAVMSAFYGLIMEITQEAYLKELPYTQPHYQSNTAQYYRQTRH
ncbi:hypothetical protein [Helicobacter sp. MIT 14-3879]|uniref:hypothetical protein n=1 Tax=Helicobacter sp. MIT 14-3879 TaxID=2040649 RepID=UPI000E1F50A9|nr:hypothetical protein [Helicobacter sp. MIT 14-3879]RDU59193.1 hypothetical protein CQA44_11650 [Helicobacter sp. MIT 14-3879]